MTARDNPFERYGLDPMDGLPTITRRLKELAEDATDDAERDRIRRAWEELTLHPRARLRAALFAHPESRAPIGRPPPRERTRAPEAQPAPTLRELAERPSLVAALRLPEPSIELADGPSVDQDPHIGGKDLGGPSRS